MGPDDFDYDLPAEAIAQEPLDDRPSARLLDTTGGPVVHRTVRDLPSLLGPGDVVVVNDTRVLPARLRLRRSTGGMAEVLLLHAVDGKFGDPALEIGARWEALVRPSRRLPPGSELSIGGDPLVRDLVVEVGLDLGEGRRHVTLWTSEGD